MSIEQIISDIQAAISDIGYEVYFGSMGHFNTVKDTPEKVLIVSPFNAKPEREGACHFDTNITFWVGLRRKVSDNFRDSTGANVTYMDELLTDTTSIIKAISNHVRIRVNQNIATINLQYYEADAGASVMSQAFYTFSIPVTVWKAQS